MKYLLYAILISLLLLPLACSRLSRQYSLITDALQIAATAPDSALTILASLDPTELKEDSLKALYAIAVGTAHKSDETSMASDSLTRFATDYYRNTSRRRYLQAADLYALHRFWKGDGRGALAMLDSLIAMPDVPKRELTELLRSRIGVGGTMFDCERNIHYIRHLMAIDTDSANQLEYKYQLGENYQFAGRGDSALIIIDQLSRYAADRHLSQQQFQYEYEKIGILEEMGRYAESNDQVDYILAHAPHNSAVPYLHFFKALNYFNLRHYTRSEAEMAYADSCANGREDVEVSYYESFAAPLREFLEYHRTGSVHLNRMATQNNSRRDFIDRMESTRHVTEQKLLREENRALALKVQSERKTYIIVIVGLLALLIAGVAFWNIQKRKRRIVEAEERAETLRRMIDELERPAPAADRDETLRRAMLQQLGIIKMVAETPTEQNREMLRKISSLSADTEGSLVNWPNVYEIIDNLYSGFHSRIHDRFGALLTPKEVQIIALMTAGFSTKEIGVITSQTSATIYVRKSAIRKKLSMPEKEDIVAYLRRATANQLAD